MDTIYLSPSHYGIAIILEWIVRVHMTFIIVTILVTMVVSLCFGTGYVEQTDRIENTNWPQGNERVKLSYFASTVVIYNAYSQTNPVRSPLRIMNLRFSQRCGNSPLVPNLLRIHASPHDNFYFLTFSDVNRNANRKVNWEPTEHSFAECGWINTDTMFSKQI